MTDTLIKLLDDEIVSIVPYFEESTISDYNLCDTCGPELIPANLRIDVMFKNSETFVYERHFLDFEADAVPLSVLIDYLIRNLDQFASMTREDFIKKFETDIEELIGI